MAEKGRLGWQRETDYGKRSKAETAMADTSVSSATTCMPESCLASRPKPLIGVAILNRMIDVGRLDSVRVA